jgi:HEAT repeat protein
MAVRNVEAELAQMGALRDAPPAEAEAALRKALSDRVNVIVAKAAKIIAERRMSGIVPDLLRAFDRLFEKPVQRDPQCWGKSAIAKALVELEYREGAPYLRGVGHIQMEPVWAGEADTASTLRGTCVLALVACRDVDPEVVQRHLVDALADRAAPVRIEAIRALALLDGGLLLRYKAHVGDEEPTVIAQVFDSLLALERKHALPFLAGFLKSKNEVVREEAALAMGASRLPEAVPMLIQAWQSTREQVLLRALGVSRQDEAIAFLKDLVENGRKVDAEAARDALAL